MIEIKELLGGIGGRLLKEEQRVSSIAEGIRSVTGITINKKDVKNQGFVAHINTKSIYKNEILIKKDKILLKIRELLGDKDSPKDIR